MSVRRDSSPFIINAILLAELFAHCRSDSLSEDGLREIIERHKCAPNNKDIQRYDFFHKACYNKRVTDGIIRCLLEYFPDAASATDLHGRMPLHILCRNKNVTLEIVRLLIDAFPSSLHQEDDDGWMPLHCLCANENLDDAISLEILKLLVEKCPESVRHADSDGDLPLHSACGWGEKSPEFCRILIKAYPGSEQYANNRGALPFHCACYRGTVATAEYLYKLYPEAINTAAGNGWYPIHFAFAGIQERNDTSTAIEMVRFLLDCDGSSLRQVTKSGLMPLHYVCGNKNLDDSVSLEILTLFVEKCPESIRHANSDGNLPIHLACGRGEKSPQFCSILIEAYPESVRYANNFGSLPFHCACLFGTVATAEYLHKLYPEAINTAARNGSFPIHYAIVGIHKRNDTSTAIGMVRFLLDCDKISLHEEHNGGWMPLHYVCRNQNLDDAAALEILTLFVEKCPESIRHADSDGNLPIHLACGRGGKSPEFCRTLIEAYPGSERTADNSGALPFHCACLFGTVATAEYLYKLYPNAINMADKNGRYPIHYAVDGRNKRNYTSTAIEMVRFLLDCDGSSLRQVTKSDLMPLHYVCGDKNLDDAFSLEILTLFVEKCPESVRHANSDGNLPIHLACGRGEKSPEFCSILIEAYPGSERTADNRGALPFHLACGYGTVATAEYLYKLYPEAIDVTDEYGRYPIFFAFADIQKRNDTSTAIEMVRFLLDCDGSSLRQVTKSGMMPLHYVCGNKNLDDSVSLEILTLFVEKCPESIRHANRDGNLPIHLACGRGDKSPEFCRILIDAYPESVRYANNVGSLPFHHACLFGTVATAEYLHKLYPEAINTAARNGLFPIHFAINGISERNDTSTAIGMVRFLLDCDKISLHEEHNGGWMPLHYVCRNQNLDDAAALEILTLFVMKCPESIRHANRDGNLPIHLACGRGEKSPEFCSILIEAYPESVRYANNVGSLPFHHACLFGTVATAEYLHKLYPEAINTAARNGLFPIHYAFSGIYKRNDTSTAIGMVRFLLDCDGSSLRQVTKSGLMPLHYVCGDKNLDNAAAFEILTLFVEKCPESIRHANRDGNLPIHLACGRGGKSPEFCRTLIEAYPGSEQMADNRGALPFHLACGYGTVATAEYLYKLYPNAINMADKNGRYPIHYAVDGRNKRNYTSTAIEMVRFLLDCDGSSLRQVTKSDLMPLHYVCGNKNLDDAFSLEILTLFVEKCPESIRHANSDGNLPIHLACGRGEKSPEFCSILIEAYPESVRYANKYGSLPFHCACLFGTVATAEYLHKLYPEAINTAARNGSCPIHYAVVGIQKRNDTSTAIGMVRFLLDCDKISLHEEDNGGWMPLHYVCRNQNLDDAAALEILTLFVEKCPESVRHANSDGNLPIHLACGRGGKSPEFCRSLIEAYPGSERTADNSGALPFHCACLFGTVATAEYLYKLYPEAIDVADERGLYPIHYAFSGIQKRNDTSTAIGMVRLLIDSFPGSLHQDNNFGLLSLHYVCGDKNLDDAFSFEILKLLVVKCPESVRHANSDGNLPIHLTCSLGARSPEFCRTLIDAYPESVRYANNFGALPFHWACKCGTVATAEYLYELYPEAINTAAGNGWYPIHYAVDGIQKRKDTSTAINMVRFLLDCDLNVAALQTRGGKLPLAELLASSSSNTSMLNAYLEVMRLLFDAHPAAIENNGILSNLGTLCPKMQTFINTQLTHVRKARDYRLMTTPDESGQLPLHRALRDNVTLGSIKLLVRGNLFAVQTTDNSGALPLHIACQHHDLASVVQYLLGFHATTICAVDLDNNTALHYACRGAKHCTIALLLEKYDAASVSKRNAQNKLPINMLLESDQVRDKEGIEYMDSVYRLIRAYPETLMDWSVIMTKQATFEDFPSHIVKKRKFGVD